MSVSAVGDPVHVGLRDKETLSVGDAPVSLRRRVPLLLAVPVNDGVCDVESEREPLNVRRSDSVGVAGGVIVFERLGEPWLRDTIPVGGGVTVGVAEDEADSVEKNAVEQS